MKKIFCAAIIILFAISVIGISYADTGCESKFSGPAKKAVRGGMNLLCGWTDIPRSIFEVTMDTKNAVLGLTVGAWQGFKKAFPRTISGAVDLATFPIPDYEKSPVKPDPLVESGTARASAPATK
ncbi:MAG: exosortase system-associated protein, TIGR04073 family [Candidatus Omnitrophica bacterium]|nr:exosortase system-associated protein, TIGR04073 family [Candidatus Omnitrophota bacterium]